VDFAQGCGEMAPPTQKNTAHHFAARGDFVFCDSMALVSLHAC
jgi:hypothetical protein